MEKYWQNDTFFWLVHIHANCHHDRISSSTLTANDSHQPVTYNMMHNKSLGLNGLMAAPSLRPDSSDSVSGIGNAISLF